MRAGFHSQPVYDLQWMNNDTLIVRLFLIYHNLSDSDSVCGMQASAGGDGQVHISDVQENRWVINLSAHSNSLRSVRPHPSDHRKGTLSLV